jgi:hypothetical protein
MKAAVQGSLSDFSRASKSSKGTSSKPGMKGPKPSKEEGSVEDDTAAKVRPQKLFLANTTCCMRVKTQDMGVKIL